MDSTLVEKITLAFKVLSRWEVLVTLGGFVFVWIILRSVANPAGPKPKPIKFQQKKAAPAEVKPAESEDAEDDDSPRSRRAAPPEDDDDEVID